VSRKTAARQTDIAPRKGKPGDRSKPEPKQTLDGHGSGRQVGEPDPKKKGADGLEEVRSARSTQRTGEPFTRGRSGQKYVAFKGNMGRTRKAG
jgi:hypothetical protein